MKKVLPILLTALTLGCTTVPIYYVPKKPIPIEEIKKEYSKFDLEQIAKEENRMHWRDAPYRHNSLRFYNPDFEALEYGLKTEDVIFIYNNNGNLEQIKDVKIKFYPMLEQNTIEFYINGKRHETVPGDKMNKDFNHGKDGGFYFINEIPAWTENRFDGAKFGSSLPGNW
jgi:hypothetical protein